MRTSLLNAQHWMEKGSAAIKQHQHHGNPKHAPDLKRLVTMVRLHVQEAEIAFGQGTDVHRQTLVPQLEQTLLAHEEFDDLAFDVNVSNDRTIDEDLRVISKGLETQRSRLHLQHDPKHKSKSRHHADRSNDTYERTALGPVLELLRLECESTLSSVHANPKQGVQTVTAAAPRLVQHAHYAAELAKLYERNDEGKTVGRELAGASRAVFELWNWVVNRKHFKPMLVAYEPVMTNLDLVRAEAKLGPVKALQPTPDNGFQIEAKLQDGKAFAAATRRFDNVQKADEAHVTSGTNLFERVVALKDPPSSDNKWEDLATSLLTAVVGNVLGFGLGAVVSQLAEAVTKKALSEGAKDIVGVVAGAGADTAQSWISDGLSAAKGDAGTADGLKFAVAYFLASIERCRAAGYKRAGTLLNQAIEEGNISAAEIHALATKLERRSRDLDTRTANELFHGFSLFMAQSALGVDQNKVTKIGNSTLYFGIPDPLHPGNHLGEELRSLDRPNRIYKQSNTTGIAKVVVDVDGGGEFDVNSVAVEGLNSAAAKALVHRAAFHLDRLGVPTEIEFDVRWAVEKGTLTGHRFKRETPKIIVDETGRVRGSEGWEMFTERSSAMARFGTPELAWRTIKEKVIPFHLFPTGGTK